MRFKKVVIIGGGVLGTQIGLMSAYTGHDTTLWLRSEGSVGRTQPKVEQYSAAMIADLEAAKQLIGNPMGALLYPRGLIRSWEGCTAEGIAFADIPAFSVQYHPEATPGPTDSRYLFTAFARLMDGRADYLDIDIAQDRLIGSRFS